MAVPVWGLRVGVENLNIVYPQSVALRSIGAFDIGLLIAIPAWLLGHFIKYPRYKAVAQTWTWAGAFMVVMAPANFGPLEQDALTALLNIAGLIVYIALVLARAWLQYKVSLRELLPPQTHSVSKVLFLAPLPVIPWLLWGAFGSVSDIAISLFIALLFGLAVSLTLELFLLRPLRTEARSAPLATFTASAALAVMAAGLRFDYFVLNLLLMLTIGTLGWAIVELGKDKVAWVAVTALVGLVAAGPITLLDPKELFHRGSFFYAPNVPDLITLAAWASAGLGLLAGAVLFIGRGLPNGFYRIGIAITWGVSAFSYATFGQVGLYGEHFFVVMREQADLSDAASIEDAAQRREAVYKLLVDQARSSQAEIRALLDSQRMVYTPYYLVNGIEINADPAFVYYLSTRPDVERVVTIPIDRPLPFSVPKRIETGDAAAPTDIPANLKLIGADRVWTEFGAKGEGIVIMGMDRGVQWDHPELIDGYRGADGNFDYNWFDPEAGTSEPYVYGAHGTHSLAVAVGNHTGVAPEASWYYCAMGNTITLRLGCWQFALAPFPRDGDSFKDGNPTLGANISTNSWECAICDGSLLAPAVRALKAAGLFVTAAAGNYGSGCGTISNPIANLEEVFTVGGVWSDGRLVDWSSRGPNANGHIKPDLLAPGVEILSATPGSTYAIFSGTSFSAPHVAGVVALMWSANPALLGDVAQTEEILRQTATPYTEPVKNCNDAGQTPNNSAGYGVVNAYEAVKAAMIASP